MVKRVPWLSVTPEPERELPAAVATSALRRSRRPTGRSPRSGRIERLILRGSERRWDRYLHGVVELIDAVPAIAIPRWRKPARSRSR